MLAIGLLILQVTLPAVTVLAEGIDQTTETTSDMQQALQQSSGSVPLVDSSVTNETSTSQTAEVTAESSSEAKENGDTVDVVTEEEDGEESDDPDPVSEGETTAESEETEATSEDVTEKAKITPNATKKGAIGPQAVALSGNYVTEFSMILKTADGDISLTDGSTVEIDPTKITGLQYIYDMEFPDDLEILEETTYSFNLPEVTNIIPTPGPISIHESPDVYYEIDTDGKVTISFPDGWETGDHRELKLDLTQALNVEIFNEDKVQEIEVPYSEDKNFHAILIGKKDGVEGQDYKQGFSYTLNGDTKTETTYRPTHADWKVRVNDQMGVYSNASVVDELSSGHTLVVDSVKVYRVKRDLDGNPIGDRTLVSVDEYTIDPSSDGFKIDFKDDIKDTYEIEYTTTIEQELVENETTINNNATITLGDDSSKVNYPIELEWGNDFDPITKKGQINANDKTLIDWYIEYNFSGKKLGDVVLTDTIDFGTIISDSIKIYEVDVDQNGQPQNWRLVQVTPEISNDGKTATITIPDSDGKSYVMELQSDVPPNKVGEVLNKVDDNNPNTPEAEDTVEYNTVPTAKKSGTVKYGSDGRPYIEWTIKFNSEKLAWDGFAFQDNFDKTLLSLDEDSFELTPDKPGFNFADNIEINSAGFKFTLNGTSEKQEYTLTYKTYYTAEGLKASSVKNGLTADWLGDGIGSGDIGHPVAGIKKVANWVVGEDADGNARQEIEWTITFNSNKLILENAKLIDILTPDELEIVDGTFSMVVNGVDVASNLYTHTLTTTPKGFEIQFAGDTLPQVYTIKYRTTIPADNTGAENKVNLIWQGNTEKDNVKVEKQINRPGVSKTGEVEYYEEDGITYKKINWTVKFNTNKRIIKNLVLTDTYTPSDVELTDFKIVKGTSDEALVEGEDGIYTLEQGTGTFTVKFNDQTEAEEYTLTYSTSWNADQDTADAVNNVSVKYTGGEDTDDETIVKPTLTLQKAATNVSKKENGDVVISWEIKINTDKPYKALKDAVLEDTIENDQRYVDGSLTLDTAAYDEDSTWSGSYDDNTRKFTINLPDGAATHTVTYQTTIYSYPSNDGTIQDKYNNIAKLTNYSKADEPEIISKDASARYFKEGENNKPTKSGIQNEDTDLIEWTAMINPHALPIKGGYILDELDVNQDYVGAPEVYAVIDGEEVLVPTSGYTFRTGTGEDGTANFRIDFNGPTTVTPNEKEHGIHYTYVIKYSTSLKPDVIGIKEVANTIKVVAYDKDKIIEEGGTSTTGEKWYFGGSGSSINITFKGKKVITDLPSATLANVPFTWERITGKEGSEKIAASGEVVTNDQGRVSAEGVRAGRYRITETWTDDNFLDIAPIYLIIGYDENKNSTLELANSDWSTPGTHPNVTVDESGELVITNTPAENRINIPVQKVWDDVENVEGFRPESITAVLVIDGEESDQTLELNEDNNWYGVFIGLDKDHEYEVKEVTVTMYESVITGDPIKGFTITNSRTPEKVTVEGTKTWDDDKDRDRIRPESITVNLLADGEVFDTIEVTEEDDWKYEFTDLPKYVEGKEVLYSIEEVAVDKYETSIDGYNIINSYEPVKVSVSGKKTWDDANNQDNKRPGYITVHLLADGDKIGSQTVRAEDNWKYEFTNLPKFAEGTEIVYTVEEDAIEGYEATYDGMNITNTHKPEQITLSGEKTWDDNDNQDGVRPDSIYVYLKADGVVVAEQEVTLGDDGKWTYSFEGQPKFKAGKAIIYTVQEKQMDGYTPTYSANGLSIKNSHKPAETYVEVTKTWSDSQNQDGIRPESVKVQLFADGEATDEFLVLDASNNWRGIFDGLDKFKSGKEIEYTVKEVSVEDSKYKAVITGSQASGYLIDNQYTPEITTISGIKHWHDDNDRDGKRPESITVYLLVDNKRVRDEEGKYIKQEVKANEDGEWVFSFDNLPKRENGKIIDYSVEEVKVADYQQGYEFDGTVVDIYNSYTPGLTSVSVRKVWEDSDNQDGIRPDAITVQLLADGEVIQEQELNEENDWKFIFADLDEYKQGEVGQLVNYTIEEVDVEGYESIVTPVDSDGENSYAYQVTNSYMPEVIALEGTKTWDDADNQDGKRPESITVNLYADDNEEPVRTATVSEATNWTYAFESLPKFRDQGVEINYFAREVNDENVAAYTPEYTESGIINHYKPGKTYVDVVKVWNDMNDKDGLRPDEITVQLLANGKVVDEQKVTVKMAWRYIFTDLDEYQDGELIEYTVKEVNVAKGYESSISGTAKDGFTITNTHKPTKPEKEKKPTKKPNKGNKHGKLPQTGENNGIMLMVLGLALIVLTASGYVVYKRKS